MTRNYFFAGLLLCLCANAQAADVAWVKVADGVFLDRHDLQLNGAGVRSKFFLDLYIAALYLVEKKSAAAEVFADQGEKRIALHLMRDISSDHLFSALDKAIAANHTPAELAALDGPIRELSEIFIAMKEANKGDVITLDYLPGRGTRVSVNGALKGAIAGTELYTALLKVWLGDKPAQEDLKLKLLGQ